MATMPSDEEHSLKEVEAYVKKYEIQQTLKECIVQLCISKPDKPFAFLRDYFDKLDKVSSYTLHGSIIYGSEGSGRSSAKTGVY